MRQAILVWSLWQRLLRPVASAFTRPGYRRFVEWVTALALNAEEHTITQSVVAIERTTEWKAMESFAEYGSWKADTVTRSLAALIKDLPGLPHLICRLVPNRVSRRVSPPGPAKTAVSAARGARRGPEVHRDPSGS
jgi:hypothetical protein